MHVASIQIFSELEQCCLDYMLRTRNKDAHICPWFKLFCVGCKGRLPNTGFRIHSRGQAEVKQEHVKGNK